MTELFLKLLNMSIDAGWLVVAVMLLRLLFRNAPKWLFPVLWSLVGIRLLLPELPNSQLSIVPDIYTLFTSAQAALPAEAARSLPAYVGAVWFAGVVIMLLFEVTSYVRLRSKVKTAVRLRANVYQSEYVNAPLIIGFFKPHIYVPFHMDRKALDSVVAHEHAHIIRHDHWIKPIAFLLLSVYWFNPLLWTGYLLLCKDIEFACDARAVKDMEDAQRAAYAQALLSCTANRRFFAACPLAFGSRDVKKRIRAVLAYKKPRTWVVIVASVLILTAVPCFLTNPKQHKNNAYAILSSEDTVMNQAPSSDFSQLEQDASDAGNSVEKHATQELESALTRERLREQEPTLSQAKSN